MRFFFTGHDMRPKPLKRKQPSRQAAQTSIELTTPPAKQTGQDDCRSNADLEDSVKEITYSDAEEEEEEEEDEEEEEESDSSSDDGAPRPKKPIDRSMHSDDDWVVTHHGTEHVTLLERATDNKFTVHENRLGKAKLKLSYNSACLGTRACKCSRKCFRLFTTLEILEFRRPLFEAANEEEASEHLAVKLRASKGKLQVVTGSPRCQEVKTVCIKFYALLHGVSRHKVETVKKSIMRGSIPVLSRGKKNRRLRGAVDSKYLWAYSFWSIFFEQNCQRPNDTERLFPVAKTFETIYKEYYLPWLKRNFQTDCHSGEHEKAKASFSTFYQARLHEDFKDVKKRAKHTHSRCIVCAEIKNLMLAGFQDGATEASHQQMRRMHDAEVKAWRLMEKVYKDQAVTNPGEILVIMHDGTIALGLPRMSHRSLKNLTQQRFEVHTCIHTYIHTFIYEA